jgi:hypothetical protein
MIASTSHYHGTTLHCAACGRYVVVWNPYSYTCDWCGTHVATNCAGEGHDAPIPPDRKKPRRCSQCGNSGYDRLGKPCRAC